MTPVRRPGARPRLVPQLFHHYSDTRVCCAPDGERFASINSDGRLKLWEIESGRLVEESLVTSSLEDVGFHPDGCSLVCTAPGGDVFRYDLVRQEVSQLTEPSVRGSARLSLRPTGDLLALGGSCVTLIDVTSKVVVTRDAEAYVGALAWAPGGERLYTGGSDGKLRCLHVSTLRLLWGCQAHVDHVFAVAVSPDGELVASGSDASGFVALWDASTLEPRGRLPVGESSVLGLAFDPEGGSLAAGGNDGVVRVFDLKTRRLTRESAELPSCVHGLFWTPDGRWLVAGVCDGSVARLDADSLQPRRSPARHELPFAALCVSHEEVWIALIGCGKVCLWSPRSGELLTLGDLEGAGTVGAFSADGRLAVGTRSRRVIVFSLASRCQEITLRLYGVPKRLIWEGDNLIARLEGGKIEAVHVPTTKRISVRAPPAFPEPGRVRLSSGAVLTFDDWERLWVQRADGQTAQLIFVDQGADLGLVAIDSEGHFDANEAGRDALWIPPAERSHGGEVLDALHRPGLLIRTLTPGS